MGNLLFLAMPATQHCPICKHNNTSHRCLWRITDRFSRAQGAAQAVEDGAVLGALFSKITHKSQLPDLLLIYETLRKSRTTRVVKGSTDYRDIFHMRDGDRQKERDRQLTAHEPFEGFPNRWADPVFQEFLFAYDADKEVDQAWEKYQRGEFPGTLGKFRASL